MLNWLKRMTGSDAPGVGTILPPEEIKLLEADFYALDRERRGISERLVRYATEGKDEEVLGVLGGIAGAAALLKLISGENWQCQGTNERKRFFSQTKCQDPLFYLRLARIYDTASTTGARRLRVPAFTGGLEWLEVFLMEATHFTKNSWPQKNNIDPPFEADLVETMVKTAGQNPDALVRGAFLVGKTNFYSHQVEKLFLCIKGFEESITRYPATIIEILANEDFNFKVHALSLLAKCSKATPLFSERIVELAVSPSKKVREGSEILLPSLESGGRQLIEKKLSEGDNDERYLAVRLIWKQFGEAARGILEERSGVEKSKKILQMISELLSAGKGNDDPVEERQPENFDLPPIEPVDPHAPLDSGVLDLLRACEEERYGEGMKSFETHRATSKFPEKMVPPNPVNTQQMEKAFQFLQELVLGENEIPTLLARSGWASSTTPYRKLVESAQMKLINVVRLQVLLGLIKPERASGWGGLSWPAQELITHYLRSHKMTFNFREVAAVFQAVGMDDRMLADDYLRRGRWAAGRGFHANAESTWPYFAERQQLLEEALDMRPSTHQSESYWKDTIRQNAFNVIAAFPRVPSQFLPVLWEIALGATKTERPLAQRCLENAPGKTARIIAALSSGQQTTRAVAAEWLGRIKEPDTVEPLVAALRKEKSEIPKSAMMVALETLGVPIDQFLDRKGLAKEAEKGLSKGVPSDLGWFPFSLVPVVRWKDTGEVVTPEIIKWFLVQSTRLKNAEPSPLLRQYCAHFQDEDRAKLGRFVMETWIAEDTMPANTADEAAHKAAAYAKQYKTYFPDLTEEQIYSRVYNRFLIQPKGSAIGSKGVLAVAAATATGTAAGPVGRYLKQWYGTRAAQGKALIQMLSWIEDPAAIQLLLAIGNRFRTKGIQEEAAEKVKALAERKGWTLDELADRTIPAAGFDEQGTIEIDYGVRKFTARLGEDFSIVLTNESGKEVASLPDANKSEDETLVKQFKSMLSVARKELKTTLKMQRERLYESMCTQRTWRFSEWDIHLNRHPVMGRYCQLLVWVVFDGEKATQSFRPLADHTLTDYNDEPVELPLDAVIRLAHECNVPPGQNAKWLGHFSDYKVAPLFEQFGKQVYILPDQAREANEIDEFKGHILEAFKLRGRATKFGYTRGGAEDGGWFCTYRKSFQSLELELTLEFTGNSLPEENRTVALRTLSFERKPAGGEPARGEKMLLREVPPVLLSECWNDMRSLAAEGPGFDSDWEKKTSM